MTSDEETGLTTAQMLQGVPWLASSSARASQLLLQHASVRRYERHEAVFHRGDAIDVLRVVIAGRLELGRAGADGQRFVAAYVPPGEAVGFIPMLDGHGAIHDARAVAPATVLCISKADFLAAMQADLDWLQTVLLKILERGRRLNEWRTQASMLSLATRLAQLLSSLAVPFGMHDKAHGDAVVLRLTQDDVAAMLGVTRQALHAEIKTLERKGMIELGYARVILRDPKRLADFARDPTVS
jgi:CRP/FNR family transcriptional regulator, cyclic AMP receptor protein